MAGELELFPHTFPFSIHGIEKYHFWTQKIIISHLVKNAIERNRLINQVIIKLFTIK